MAKVRWGSTVFEAKPIEQLPNGIWVMEALVHGPRFTVGGQVHVQPDEVMDWGEASVDVAQSAAELDKAMAEERKTLPPVETLLLAAQSKTGS